MNAPKSTSSTSEIRDRRLARTDLLGKVARLSEYKRFICREATRDADGASKDALDALDAMHASGRRPVDVGRVGGTDADAEAEADVPGPPSPLTRRRWPALMIWVGVVVLGDAAASRSRCAPNQYFFITVRLQANANIHTSCDRRAQTQLGCANSAPVF